MIVVGSTRARVRPVRYPDFLREHTCRGEAVLHVTLLNGERDGPHEEEHGGVREGRHRNGQHDVAAQQDLTNGSPVREVEVEEVDERVGRRKGSTSVRG